MLSLPTTVRVKQSLEYSNSNSLTIPPFLYLLQTTVASSTLFRCSRDCPMGACALECLYLDFEVLPFVERVEVKDFHVLARDRTLQSRYFKHQQVTQPLCRFHKVLSESRTDTLPPIYHYCLLTCLALLFRLRHPGLTLDSQHVFTLTTGSLS